MQTQHFARFAPVIKSLSVDDLAVTATPSEKLRLAQSGSIEVFYAPFDHINPAARIVIVGITPGRTQMMNALREAKRQLDSGADHLSALSAAKKTGAFSGSMRPNLVAMLDCVSVNRWLGIDSCDALFGKDADLVQTASVQSNPVFINGENYNGTPSMIRNPLLKEQLLTHFGQMARSLPNALFIPLGDKVAEALHYVAGQKLLDQRRILDGLPHPSGANAERIAYFLGKKQRKDLSTKTNPEKLEQARQSLIERINALT